MNVTYLGINKKEERYQREAFISFDEEKESERADKMYAMLTELGYKVYCEQDCMSIPVSNKSEYDIFLEDYKNCKKVVKGMEENIKYEL